MTDDREFFHLDEPPEPSEGALERALAAALAGYDARHPRKNAGGEPPREDSVVVSLDAARRATKPPQDTAEPVHRKTGFFHRFGNLAACGLLVVVGGTVALRYAGRSNEQTFAYVGANMSSSRPGVDVAAHRNEAAVIVNVPADAAPRALPAANPPEPPLPVAEEADNAHSFTREANSALASADAAPLQDTDHDPVIAVFRDDMIPDARLGNRRYAFVRAAQTVPYGSVRLAAADTYRRSPDGDNPQSVSPDGFIAVAREPFSPVPFEVDTASYFALRESLENHRLPPESSVRTAACVNHFSYNYPTPASADRPFKTTVSVIPSPWRKDERLLLIGIRGYAPAGAVNGATPAGAPIAEDVEVHVEFNPGMVSGYRLVGYNARPPAERGFSDDAAGAGDIGPGYTVTAMFELLPASDAIPSAVATEPAATEYGVVNMRYKLPEASTATYSAEVVTPAEEYKTFGAAPADARFAVAVASFAELVKGGKRTGSLTFSDVLAMAEAAKGEDRSGERAGFIALVRKAQTAR
ncbi:MAG: von Willebrand factor type A domain-containing protein [Methylobacteriaceae bacterium]|jgi:hypothetical protein|nr:von Willebrand factor type A domain-containing protein [Methylobacteriaceae bacterium]